MPPKSTLPAPGHSSAVLHPTGAVRPTSTAPVHAIGASASSGFGHTNPAQPASGRPQPPPTHVVNKPPPVLPPPKPAQPKPPVPKPSPPAKPVFNAPPVTNPRPPKPASGAPLTPGPKPTPSPTPGPKPTPGPTSGTNPTNPPPRGSKPSNPLKPPAPGPGAGAKKPPAPPKKPRSPPVVPPPPPPKTSGFLAGVTKSWGAAVTGAATSTLQGISKQVASQATAVASSYADALRKQAQDKIATVMGNASNTAVTVVNHELGSINHAIGLGNIQIPAGTAPGVPEGGPVEDEETPSAPSLDGNASAGNGNSLVDDGNLSPVPQPIITPNAGDVSGGAIAPRDPTGQVPMVPKNGDTLTFDAKASTPITVVWNDVMTGDTLSTKYYHNLGSVTSSTDFKTMTVDIFLEDDLTKASTEEDDLQVTGFPFNTATGQASGQLSETISFGLMENNKRFVVINTPAHKLLQGCLVPTSDMQALDTALRALVDPLDVSAVQSNIDKIVAARGDPLRRFDINESLSMTDDELNRYRVAERERIKKIMEGKTDAQTLVNALQVGG